MVSPPVAPRRPSRRTLHGVVLTDDYAWLKDGNWQEVLRDPSRLDHDIRSYLEAENRYTDAILAPTETLQKALVAEMRGRIKEDESGVPLPDGPYAYLWKYREGGQHALIGRVPRDGGDFQLVLDGDALAKASGYFKFGGRRHSPDHQLEAWSADQRGSEYFTIRVRRWTTGEDAADIIEQASGNVVWGRDSTFFYYVRVDDNHRPLQVFRHRLGSAQSDDLLVYEEKDPGWFTHIAESASGRFCVISVGDHDTSEQWLVDLSQPDAVPRLVAPRETGIRYSVADRGDELFILANDAGAIDFRIVTAPLSSPGRESWRELVPHRPGIYVLGLELYANHLVRLERAHDGAEVPVSILHRRDLPLDGKAPLLLYGYGSYGISIPAAFSSNRLSLVDRGFVYAIAHIRGGADKGWSWYLDGKRENKTNTFDDFVAAARTLIERRYTSAGRIVGHGGSAGGMLMGAVANRAGELFAGIVAEVPFVDVLNTMLDDTLPLTPPEWPEWGNPIADEAAFRTILSYSPYENVQPKAYPAILAMAGLTDPRVTYWEPAKWVARLRATMTSGGPVLLHTNMGAGHGGAAGRFDRLDEVAIAYAFALWAVAEGKRHS